MVRRNHRYSCAAVALQDDGTLINEVSFKTLGLLPGFSRQYGQIRPLSGDTFLVSSAGATQRLGRGNRAGEGGA